MNEMPFVATRAARPEDEPAIARFLQTVEPMSVLLQRFLTPSVGNGRTRGAVLASGPRGEVLGLAQWKRSTASGETAEVAVIVAEAVRRRGVGRRLAADVVRQGASVGIRRWFASLLPGDRAGLALLRAVDASAAVLRDGIVNTVVATPRVAPAVAQGTAA